MRWKQIVRLLERSCEEQDSERNVLLVLSQSSHHVKSVLTDREQLTDDMLGFEVWADDPSVSNRTSTTKVLFVNPDEVKQILLDRLPAGGLPEE